MKFEQYINEAEQLDFDRNDPAREIQHIDDRISKMRHLKNSNVFCEVASLNGDKSISSFVIRTDDLWFTLSELNDIEKDLNKWDMYIIGIMYTKNNRGLHLQVKIK